MSKSPARQAQCAVSDPREREAAALLYQAGWSVGELAMTFQLDTTNVRRVLAAEGVADE